MQFIKLLIVVSAFFSPFFALPLPARQTPNGPRSMPAKPSEVPLQPQAQDVKPESPQVQHDSSLATSTPGEHEQIPDMAVSSHDIQLQLRHTPLEPEALPVLHGHQSPGRHPAEPRPQCRSNQVAEPVLHGHQSPGRHPAGPRPQCRSNPVAEGLH